MTGMCQLQALLTALLPWMKEDFRGVGWAPGHRLQEPGLSLVGLGGFGEQVGLAKGWLQDAPGENTIFLLPFFRLAFFVLFPL